MGWKTKEGPYIYATNVTKIECDSCGTVLITKYPTNDRETVELIQEHGRHHGGIDRG